jgi:hypothetical protein
MLHVRMNVPPVRAAIERAAEGLVGLNEWMMEHAWERGGIELPPLYESGVVYRREPPGREWWETARDLVSIATHRSGDCEDLAAYRAAELRFYEGENARLVVIRTKRRTFHAIVEREDGTLEDPSRICVNLEKARTGRAEKVR